MTGTFGRSFQLVTRSWKVLMQDKEILLFPVFSCIAFIIVLISFLTPVILLNLFVQGEMGAIFGICLLFLFYLVSYCIVIFFNTALITCANIRLSGGDPTLSDGISNAVRHGKAIFAWALIAATVGLILQVIAEKTGIAGQIVTGLIGAAWSLVTFFVVPVLIFEDTGVVDAMKGSVALFRKTWGETMVGSGSVFLIFFALGIACAVPLGLVILTASWAFLIPVLILTLVIWFILGVIASAMQGVFVTALYRYAKTGDIPGAFGEDLVKNAFKAKIPGFRPGNI